MEEEMKRWMRELGKVGGGQSAAKICLCCRGIGYCRRWKLELFMTHPNKQSSALKMGQKAVV